MKFGSYVLQANMHWFLVYFQDGSHDTTSWRKVLPSGECKHCPLAVVYSFQSTVHFTRLNGIPKSEIMELLQWAPRKSSQVTHYLLSILEKLMGIFRSRENFHHVSIVSCNFWVLLLLNFFTDSIFSRWRPPAMIPRHGEKCCHLVSANTVH